MRQSSTDDELLRSYLLGELPESEADRLEQRLLAEDELFDLLEALEAELFAAGSRGELAPAERERVFRRLASSPEGRERLALARSLNTLADGLSEHREVAPVVPFPRRAAGPKPGFQWAALAAAGLLAATGLFWFTQRTPNGGDSAPVVAHERPAPASPVRPAPQAMPVPPVAAVPAPQQPRTAPDQLVRKEARENPVKRPEPVKAVLALSLMALRGSEEIEQLDLPAGAEIVELQLDLEGREDSGSFHAAVRRKSGEPIWETSGLKAQLLDWGTALVLDVPAKLLTPGRYEVGVTAGAETEEVIQQFEVARQEH
ncbi:MAG TPA: hypothetical protein VHC97_07840 [Thermoanaerobaculia bacterium]|jgi:hypothetical protein|nr:hypothetical protein [Thermoanaerobaculia bacterium]